jgi:hypothetical protein
MLKLVFWIVVFVLAISFFGVSLKGLVESPATHQNFQYLWELIVMGWNNLVHLGGA